MDFNFGALLRKFSVGDTTVASGRPLDAIRRDLIFNMALYDAFKWATIGGGTIATAVVAATLRNKNFKKFMSLSAKVSLPTMATMFIFSITFESTVARATRFPENYGLSDTQMIKKAQLWQARQDREAAALTTAAPTAAPTVTTTTTTAAAAAESAK